jgi:SAM-dependent methyltransferase
MIDRLMPDATRSQAEQVASGGAVERFEPDVLRGELLEAEHFVRYLWAADAVAEREVLDLGCGTGYGAALMSSFGGARRCVGVDNDAESIAGARERYGSDERLEFVEGDVTALQLGDETFDAITCFEVIEHVPDARAVIVEAKRLLRRGGLFLVSSPNRAQYPPGNPYHVKELTPDELRALLSERFGNVRLLRQHNWLASSILDDERFESDDPRQELPLRASKLQARKGGEELYTIAACSDGPLPELSQRALMTHGLEVRRWLDEIGEARADAYRLGDELASTRNTLAAREVELVQLRDKRSRTMGELERQAYWLQRTEIDPEAWARRRSFRWAFRLLSLARRVRRKLHRN